MQYVFISHASLDKTQHRPELRAIVDALIVAGIKVWIDKPEALGYDPGALGFSAADVNDLRIHAGDLWRDSIDKAHAKAALVLAVWSANVIARLQAQGPDDDHILRGEIEQARTAGKLVSCSIDDTPMPREWHATQIPVLRTKEDINALVRSVLLKLRSAFFDAYRKDRIEEWRQPQYGAGDELFTDLSVLLDKGEDEAERWDRKKTTYKTLPEVIADNATFKTFVLLGSPGAGKSTLLRRLDLETARAGASDPEAPFSYFVSLKQYRSRDGKSPLEWLRAKWASDWRKTNTHIQELDALLEKPGAFLLLDALNEMPRSEARDYDSLVDDWTDFIAEVRAMHWECRIIFSCRSLLYSNRLSTPEQMVPHIDILPLDPETIRAFLQHYAAATSNRLFARIEDANQFDLYSTAYFLKMLVEVAGDSGEIPGDRAELITAYVRKLLSREFLKKTPLIANRGPLAATDVERLGRLTQNASSWREYELVEDGPLFPRLADLAFAMQSAEKSKVDGDTQFLQHIVSHDFALKALSPSVGSSPDELLEAACQLSILEHDKTKREVQFIHQLIQEYFAARRLAKAPDPKLVALPWAAGKTPDRQPDNINEPLPPADSTGWEVTTIFASLMSENPERFITPLIAANLPLAGQAAAQVCASDEFRRARNIKSSRPALPQKTVAQIQSALASRMVDTKASFRVRIASGKALGELGHPALKSAVSAGGAPYQTPPVLRVPRHASDIGRRTSPHTHERHEHKVVVGPFEIAQFPVTNGEWACFMRDRGYATPRWWSTAAAEDWRAGDTTYVCRTVQWYAFRQMLQESLANDPPGQDYLKRKIASREISPEEANKNHNEALKTDEQFAEKMKTDFAGGALNAPRRWRDRNFNNPLQPVVGICWYEAIAYCAWLSERTGQRWRLPTEVEWEAAARWGLPKGADYPSGRGFSATRGNSFESHIRATTPAGLYLGQPRARKMFGAKPDRELADMSGNAYEWTSSRYDKQKFKYPYKAEADAKSLKTHCCAMTCRPWRSASA